MTVKVKNFDLETNYFASKDKEEADIPIRTKKAKN